VITFDEHGGCFDHVSPPTASPPDAFRPVGQFGFKFDRLGVRVPAVLVSAYIEPRTIINTELSHASMIRTLTDKWNLGHLTDRDWTTTNFSEAFNRAAARPREDWPVIRPREMPPDLARANNHDHPPNPLQRDIVGLAVAVGGDSLFHPGEVITVVDAIGRMRKEIGSQEQQVKK
jgi:phospholipase C